MQPFIGQICTFGFNFAPREWAACNGQLLPISENEALFSLIGTMYGGDGRTTFGVPDLQGRSAVHQGQGAGLSNMRVGQKGGQEYITLTEANLPSHSHTGHLDIADESGTTFNGKNAYLAKKALDIDVTPKTSVEMYVKDADAHFTQKNSLLGVHTGNTGGGQSFASRSPYQVVNICIALQGIFPSRN